MKTIFIFMMILIMTSAVAAPKQYSNCEFKFKPYEKICTKAVNKSVSIQYANEFLLSNKAKKLDLKSFALFNPKKITVHASSEKRANNALLHAIPEIIRHLSEYSDVYDYTETKYHVNREIIAAILAKETRLGKIKPAHDAFIVFNTILKKLKPISKRDHWLRKMATENMISIMVYCYSKNINPNHCNFSSSYAGAVGIPQFMPQNFKYIEGYKKPIGNLSNMRDAIVSTGKYLHYHANFTQMIEWHKVPPMEKVENDWYDYDFKTKNASFAKRMNHRTKHKYNCYSCEKKTLRYLRDYVKIIMKYNNSSNYAIGILRLADESRNNY